MINVSRIKLLDWCYIWLFSDSPTFLAKTAKPKSSIVADRLLGKQGNIRLWRSIWCDEILANYKSSFNCCWRGARQARIGMRELVMITIRKGGYGS